MIQGILSVLTLPVLLMNSFGIVVGAIWLAVLGKWSLIGLGIAAAFVSAFALGLLLLPSAALTMAFVAALSVKNFALRLLGALALFLANFWILLVMTVWCVGCFFVVFGKYYDGGIIWPYLLWSYGMATGPWTYLASREGPEGFGASIAAFGACLGAIAIMGVLLYNANVSVFDTAIAFSVPASIVFMVQTMISFMVARAAQAALQGASANQVSAQQVEPQVGGRSAPAPKDGDEMIALTKGTASFMPNLSGYGVYQKFGGPLSPEISMEEADAAIAAHLRRPVVEQADPRTGKDVEAEAILHLERAELKKRGHGLNLKIAAGALRRMVARELDPQQQARLRRGACRLEQVAVEDVLCSDLERLKADHAKELEPLADPATKDKLASGFEAWFDQYLHDWLTAKQQASGFYEEFEELLDAQDPGLLEHLQNLQGELD